MQKTHAETGCVNSALQWMSEHRFTWYLQWYGYLYIHVYSCLLYPKSGTARSQKVKAVEKMKGNSTFLHHLKKVSLG
jgi:hypothetical protein